LDYRILFIERYRTVEHAVLPALQRHYEISLVRGRRAAMKELASQLHDMVLIDVPSIRFSLERFCDDLRERLPGMLLFFLIGEERSADELPRAHDYLRHPFTERQLLNRLSRLLPEHVGEVIDWRGLQLDPVAHSLAFAMEETFLTPKQSDLARSFLESPDELLTRARLMDEVWGTDFLGDTRTLDVHIHWLRQALKTLDAPFFIETVRGKGYKLMMEEGEEKSETVA
jgi:DNA-binding response OmpR family regulator